MWQIGTTKLVIGSGLNQWLNSQGQHLTLIYDENPYSDKYKIYDVLNYQECQRKTK